MTSILSITDGTTEVTLIAKKTGFHLKEWRPGISQLKGGGVYQNSPVAPSQRLAFGVLDIVEETFNLVVNDEKQDELIRQAQDLLRLLEKARNYSLSKAQTTPVYLKAQSTCETNIRYALIKNYQIRDLDNPYAQPFMSVGDLIAMRDIILIVQRADWLANPPGTGECVSISAEITWYNEKKWVVNETWADDTVTAIGKAANGDLYVGLASGELYKSTDDGASWVLNNTFDDQINAILGLSGGNILVGLEWPTPVSDDTVYYSDDNGTSWNASPATQTYSCYDFIELPTGTVMVSTDAGPFRSTNAGITFVTSSFDTVKFFELDSSNILWAISSVGRLSYSTDDGQNFAYKNFNKLSTSNGIVTKVTGFLIDDDDNFLAVACRIVAVVDAAIFRSTDGLYWTILGASLSQPTGQIIQLTNGLYLTIDTDSILFSGDGINWFDDDFVISLGTSLGPFYEDIDLELLFLGADDTLYQTDLSTVTLGTAASCSASSFITNHSKISNLTHVKRDDGGVFTDLFGTALPYYILPLFFVPAVNDAVYFGSNSTIDNSGRFSSIVFTISYVYIEAGFDITWEYWNGAWVTLTVHDDTKQSLGLPFSNTGQLSVHWEIPSDWITTAVDGITGYWVRFRVASATGSVVVLQQGTREIYTISDGFIETSDPVGDIPALAQLLLTNVSDEDGPGNDSPDLYDNRIIIGERDTARGENFNAFINLSDEQVPGNVNVTAGTNTSFANDATAPTGRRMTYNPAGVEAMATRATISLYSSLARDYYGIYHAYLRAQRTTGSASDISVRLQIATGSGGITYTSQSQQLQTTTAFEVLDFGEIVLPVCGYFQPTDLADVTEIRVQASAASGTPNLNLYDLILVPTDEWAIDVLDRANEDDSEVGRSNNNAKFLDVDSVTNPGVEIATLVKTVGSEIITSQYDPITAGPAILQPNVQQRLWFFAMLTSATGSTYYWLAPPEISHSIQVFKNERYLGLRGAR